MKKNNFGKLVEIMKNENLPFGNRFIKLRFEFPKLDQFWIKYGIISGIGQTSLSKNCVYSYGPSGSVVYFKEFDRLNNDYISAFNEGIEKVNSIQNNY